MSDKSLDSPWTDEKSKSHISVTDKSNKDDSFSKIMLDDFNVALTEIDSPHKQLRVPFQNRQDEEGLNIMKKAIKIDIKVSPEKVASSTL